MASAPPDLKYLQTHEWHRIEGDTATIGITQFAADELTEQTDPISAGLSWAVDLTKDFIGVEPLRKIAESGPERKLVGLELEGKRIARQGAPVMQGGQVVGEVTSGTLSPTLQKSIAMAYVDANLAAEGTTLDVDLKGTSNPAKVVKLPFYKRPA